MDLKALMQKLETIDKNTILTEAEKKETTWTDKSGKKHPATQVKGDKYTGKEAEKESKPKKDDLDEHFSSAIAQALVEEFGYELDEESLDEAENPWANDPAKSAAWAALSPEDQKWLGGADPTDQFILARAPNKGKPATTAPGAAAGAATKPAAAPAAPTGTTAQGDDEGNTMITKPDGTVQVVGPDGNVIPPGGGKQPTASATAAPPAGGAGGDAAVAKTRERMKALLDKLEKTGGVTGSAAAPAKPAAGAATKPAAKPAGGAATKPAAAPAGNSVDWNAIGASQMTAESKLTDEQTLLAIKNIKY